MILTDEIKENMILTDGMRPSGHQQMNCFLKIPCYDNICGIAINISLKMLLSSEDTLWLISGPNNNLRV